MQETFKPIYNLKQLKTDGSQFDKLFKDGDELTVGNSIHIRTMFTPGHTADSSSYILKDGGIFIGDTLFYPDKGSARCDFPNGSAELLYESIQKLLSFPDETKLFLCHDYPNDRDFKYETSVGEQKKHNIHLQPGTSFKEMRETRDQTLKIPHLLVPRFPFLFCWSLFVENIYLYFLFLSVQLNLEAGKLPEPEDNGISYIKIPLNFFENKTKL